MPGRDGERGRATPARWEVVALAACLALHIAVFVGWFGTTSLWLDDVLSLRTAGSTIAEAVSNARADIHPPLYFVVLSAWRNLAGDAEWALRLPSLISAIAAAGLLFLLVRRIAGGGAAVLAVGLLSLSPFHHQFAAEVRMYAPLGMLAVLATLLLAVSRDRVYGGGWRKGAPWLAAYVLSGMALCATHHFGALTFAAHAVWLVIVEPGRRLAAWAVLLIAAVLPVLVALPSILADAGSEGTAWIAAYQGGREVWLMPFVTWMEFALGEGLGALVLWPVALVIAAAGPLVGWAVWTAWRERTTQPDRARGVLLLALAAFVPVVLLLLVSSVRPLFIPRYAIGTLPFLVALLGIGIAAVPRPRLRVFVAVPVVALLALGLWGSRESRPKTDWRGAVEAIALYAPPDTEAFAIAVRQPGHALCIAHYTSQSGSGLEPVRVELLSGIMGVGEPPEYLCLVLRPHSISGQPDLRAALDPLYEWRAGESVSPTLHLEFLQRRPAP